MVFNQIYTLSITIIERLTAIPIVFTISIPEFLLFSFCCRQLSCVSLAPFRSTILEPNLAGGKNEKLLKINHKKFRCVFCLNHKTNRLIGRLFEMVYLTFFIATSCVEIGGKCQGGKGGFKLLLSFKCVWLFSALNHVDTFISAIMFQENVLHIFSTK